VRLGLAGCLYKHLLTLLLSYIGVRLWVFSLGRFCGQKKARRLKGGLFENEAVCSGQARYNVLPSPAHEETLREPVPGARKRPAFSVMMGEPNLHRPVPPLVPFTGVDRLPTIRELNIVTGRKVE